MSPLPAVILAAGEGRRLTLNHDLPKPLAKFGGLSLLERSIRTCKYVGIDEFYVIVGHAKERVAAAARKIARRLHVKLKVVENPEWPQGNGTSVLAVSKELNRPFFLQMVDHVFDSQILQDFLNKTANSQTTVLAVDPRRDQVLDLDDATKVKLNEGKIEDIGKNLSDFDAIDMGLFYCTPDIFEALRFAKNNGGGNLVDGVKWLAKEGRINTVSISSGEWFDIDKPEILKAAEERLFFKLQKSEDGLISRKINRKLSFAISKKISAKISPNGVTLIAFLIGILGALLFFPSGYLTTFIAGMLIQFSSILDGCDGEIARIRLEMDYRGGWLDTVLDRYVDALIVLGVTCSFWTVHPAPWVWVGGFFVLFGFLAISYVKKEYMLRTGSPVSGGLLEKLTKRDTRLFVIFCGAILNIPYYAMLAIVIFSHLWIFYFAFRIFSERAPLREVEKNQFDARARKNPA